MQPFEDLIITSDQRILTVTLNRPQARNALREGTLRELLRVFDENAVGADIGVIVITGQGDSAFCAGGDIREMEKKDVKQARKFAELSHELLSKMEQLPKPIIAAVNGVALGAGCDLAVACDICLASEKASFGMTSAKIGIISPLGGTQRLPRLIGPRNAKYLFFTGEMIDARRAKEIGLANYVIQNEALMSETKSLALRIMNQAPLAVASCKRLVNVSMDQSLRDGDNLEIELYSECFATEDKKEGMNAFLEKRKPTFKGK